MPSKQPSTSDRASLICASRDTPSPSATGRVKEGPVLRSYRPRMPASRKLSQRTPKPVDLPPRLILSQVFPIRGRGGNGLAGRPRVGGHRLERQRFNRLTEHGEEVAILLPTRVIKQEIALPAWRQRCPGDLKAHGHLVARPDDQQPVVALG